MPHEPSESHSHVFFERLPECECGAALANGVILPPVVSDEVKRLRKWQQEACIAIEAATTIGQRSGVGLNYGNHDRLLAEATCTPSTPNTQETP